MPGKETLLLVLWRFCVHRIWNTIRERDEDMTSEWLLQKDSRSFPEWELIGLTPVNGLAIPTWVFYLVCGDSRSNVWFKPSHFTCCPTLPWAENSWFFHFSIVSVTPFSSVVFALLPPIKSPRFELILTIISSSCLTQIWYESEWATERNELISDGWWFCVM